MDVLPFKCVKKYEDQTRIKHQVFEDYIDKWIKIVGANSNLIYIDGFGGMGAYRGFDGKIYYGSPILAAKTIEKNSTDLQRTVKLLIIDKNENYLKNINEIFKYEKISIKPIFIHEDFDKSINEFLDKSQSFIPTFVFIDPYGFKIKLKTILKVMKINKSEVLLNFMYIRINQFLEDSKSERIFCELFGNDDWKSCIKFSGTQREDCIVNCYRNSLKKFSKFVYPFKLEMPKVSRTYYYLFHLTNHFKGCLIMKSIFAKYNYGRLEYKGERGRKLDLFDFTDYKIFQAGEYLLNKYKGEKIQYDKLLENEIDETVFLESQIKKTLQNLEGKDLIIDRNPKTTRTGKKRGGLDIKDCIIFKKNSAKIN